MLQITIPERELWDERNNCMIYTKEVHLRLEHSLISISNWEMKWHVPYFDSNKTDEQAFDYIRCMALNKELNEEAFLGLTQKNVEDINEYMINQMTATTIGDVQSKTSMSHRKVTSELIYYWMIQFGIPFSCEKWHINRLIMLIRVCAEENKPRKNRKAKDIAMDYRAINAARRAALNTKG